MIMTQVGWPVPKFTVIVGGSFGAGNYGMCGRAYDGRFLWMWPQSQIAVMGAEQAANTLADVKIRQLQRQGQTLGEDEIAAIREPVLERYRAETPTTPPPQTVGRWHPGPAGHAQCAGHGYRRR